MTYSYIVLTSAQVEYEKSVEWYLEKSLEAATGFVAAVEETLERMCTHPHRWRNGYADYRELSLKKYPFTIIYAINETTMTIVVVSVFHHSRNQEKKYS